MPFVAAPDTVHVSVEGSLGEDLNVVNVFHYQCDTAGPYTSTQLNNIAQGFHHTWVTRFIPDLSDEYALDQVVTRDISVVNGGDGVYAATPVPGGGTATSESANNSMVLSWHEFINYRGGHPRTYLCGITVDNRFDPQRWTDAIVAVFQTAAEGFLSDVNSQAGWPGGAPTGHLSVVHYKLNKVVQTPPALSEITGVTVKHLIGSQRRRL